MNEKGQITVEAIILIGIFFLILLSITVPMLFYSKGAAEDVTVVSDARYAVESITSAVNSVVTPGSKRTIEVYIPAARSAGNVSGSTPYINITTTMDTDGDVLIANVSIKRYRSDGTLRVDDVRTITRDLYGSGWVLFDNATQTEKGITEEIGKKYDIVITWKNITWTRRS